MKGYEAFSDSLKRLKLLPVFGNPGSTELSSLKDVDDYILTQFDGLAVGMADGFSQISSSPSFVNLHTNLGLGNSMAYIFTAKMNRTPIVITAGQQDLRHISMEPLLSGDLTEFVGNNVKFRYELKTASDIPFVLRRAKMESLTPPMGPVFVSLPMNLMDEDFDYSPPEDFKTAYDITNEEVEDYVAALINSSKSPALVFGWEIDLLNAFDVAEKVAEKIGCAVYSEPLVHRASFRSDHKLYAGNLLPGSTLINLKLLQNDLIVFIGGDVLLYPYLPSPLLKDKKVIFLGLNTDPKFGEFYQVNVKKFLKGLVNKVTRKCNFSKPKDYLAATRAANERDVIGINYVMSKLKKVFGEYVIVDEAISSSISLRETFGYSPGRYFNAKSGQLGWGSPAAAGISMKRDKVLAVVGEGSFMYSLQVLWTVDNYHLPVKFLVLRNGGYSILKSYSISYYPGVEKKDFLSFKVSIESIAEGFGIDSRAAAKNLDDDVKWLAAGNEAKLLVIDVDKSIPKLFL